VLSGAHKKLPMSNAVYMVFIFIVWGLREMSNVWEGVTEEFTYAGRNEVSVCDIWG